MYLRTWLAKALALLATIGVPMASNARAAQDDDLRKLGGTWLFVEDRTEGRAVEMGGAPMSVKFALRVEKDAVIYPRSPRHGYPQRIVYELSKEDALTASIGFAKGRRQSFEFKREGK